jgi:uncharacterized membrane protein
VTPDRFRILVSTVLIVGVSTSAVLIAAGFLGSLLVGWDGSRGGASTGTPPTTDFGSLLAGLRALRPIALAQAGLLVLLATPVVRVATSVVAFWLERDGLYVVITGIVLAVLLASLFVLH